MSDDVWRAHLCSFTERRIDEAAFQDRFFDPWHAAMGASQPLPPAVEQLFYVVEAYSPDPALRQPGSRYEADDAELRYSAELALARLDDDRPSGKLK